MAEKDENSKGMMVYALYILIILQKGPTYGNNIANEINQRTNGIITCNPNILYPLLRSLEEKKYITGSWDNPDTRSKRIYSITQPGIEIIPRLKEKTRQQLNESENKIRVLRQNLFDE